MRSDYKDPCTYYGLSSTLFVPVSFQDEGDQGWLSGIIDTSLPSLVRCIWHGLNSLVDHRESTQDLSCQVGCLRSDRILI